MPKYLVTSGSVFEPFSYEDMIRPVAQLQELHNAAQNDYDVMSMETDALDQYIGEKDVKARRMYDDYRQKLKTLQDNLYNNGYTANTRRELTSARNAFAQSIGPIKSAMQARQEAGKEWYEARRKNPDLVMGENPANGTIDDYIDNPNYGSGWYSYDGSKFASAVGTAAKAAASELSRYPEYQRNPVLADYITRVTNEGFTNQEVDNASVAAFAAFMGADGAMDNLNVGERILAETLLSQAGAIGAQGNLDPSESRRLFQYGLSGLRQAVGGAKYQDRRVGNGSGNSNGSGNGYSTLGPGYHLEGSSVDLSDIKATEDANQISSLLFDQDETGVYRQKQFIVNDKVYSPRTFKDVDDILKSSPYVFQTDGDPIYGMPTYGTVYDASGKERDVRVTVDRDLIPHVDVKTDDGRWVADNKLTREYNNADPQYDPIKKIARLKKLYEKYEIPMNTPFADAFSIITTQSNQGEKTPAALAPSDEAFDRARKNYYRRIMDSFNGHGGEKQKDKTSQYGFYKVNSEDGSVESKPTFKRSHVFGNDGIYSISMVPDSFANGARGRLRIQTEKGAFEINPQMLGPEFASSMERISPIIRSAMAPLSNATTSYQGKGDTDWHYAMKSIMSELSPEARNMWDNVRISDVVLDQNLQKSVRQFVTAYLNVALAAHRESMMNNNWLNRGNTSSKASEYDYYNDYDDED